MKSNGSRLPTLLIIGFLALAFIPPRAPNVSWAEDAEAEKAEFTGVKKCKMCHKSEKQGEQFRIWTESKHSHAYETLGTPEAAEVAKAQGIKGNPQEAKECLRCHATAYEMTAEELASSKMTMEEGVSCESCHGAGSLYQSKKTMKALTAGEIEPASVGLLDPGEKTCIQCHNEESPNFPGFDYVKMYAKIAHPVPAPAEGAEK
ncbi:MAG: cytochrome C554 [Gemmatimonadetes bacterium]|nr:cytochrome C554 [Gemmatimonadota bacterium]